MRDQLKERCIADTRPRTRYLPVKDASESFELLPTDVALDSEGIPLVTFSFTATAEEADNEPVCSIVGKLSALMPRRRW